MSKARDQLHAVSAPRAVQVALQALDGIQGENPGEQVAGVFLLAYTMAVRLGLDVSELFNQSQRRFDHADTYYRREAAALFAYMTGELA